MAAIITTHSCLLIDGTPCQYGLLNQASPRPVYLSLQLQVPNDRVCCRWHLTVPLGMSPLNGVLSMLSYSLPGFETLQTLCQWHLVVAVASPCWPHNSSAAANIMH